MKRRFWKCECCDCLLVTMPQDDATSFQCPQCQQVRCRDGRFIEVSAIHFIREAEMESILADMAN